VSTTNATKLTELEQVHKTDVIKYGNDTQTTKIPERIARHNEINIQH